MPRKKVIVALSGGVDSAVAAGKLIDEGFDVEGVYMKYASGTTREFVDVATCSWQDDLAAVNKVGEHLGIKVSSINVEKEYDEKVIALFLSEYVQGRTPNPDVLCNREIKFGIFFEWALRRKADAIATGHYARTVVKEGTRLLAAGLDHDKDQSYFLYGVPPKVLERTIFPVGLMKKTEVRSYAHTNHFPNADRPDSQGVCFIGSFSVADFLRARIKKNPGPVTTKNSTVIGEHDGLSFYTIGQRHGLGIGGGTPYYVAEKNHTTNTLVVANGDSDPVLFSSGCTAKKMIWHTEVPDTFTCSVRIRYRQPLVRAIVHNGRGLVKVDFSSPQRAVAPGQAVVFYDNDIVLGGATIEQAQPLQLHR